MLAPGLHLQAFREGSRYLGKIHAKGIHVEPVQKASEGLAEARKALVHKLEMHHVGLQVGHGIRQLGEGRLERVEREWRVTVTSTTGRVAERGARGGAERGGGTRRARAGVGPPAAGVVGFGHYGAGLLTSVELSISLCVG